METDILVCKDSLLYKRKMKRYPRSIIKKKEPIVEHRVEPKEPPKLEKPPIREVSSKRGSPIRLQPEQRISVLQPTIKVVDLSRSMERSPSNPLIANISQSRQSDIKDISNQRIMGEGNVVGDFCSNIDINGSNNNVCQKNNNINIKGDYNVIEKGVKMATVEGFNHHVKVGTVATSTRGSYGYNVMSGSDLVSTEFEVDGIKKIGKAQSMRILMTALINDRGMSCLKNANLDKVVWENIYFPDRSTIALVIVNYVIISKAEKYMTGTATNTVKILQNGCSEWTKTLFRNIINENTFDSTIDIVGLNLCKYNNSASIQIHNSEGNGEIEVFATVELVSLQKRNTEN